MKKNNIYHVLEAREYDEVVWIHATQSASSLHHYVFLVKEIGGSEKRARIDMTENNCMYKGKSEHARVVSGDIIKVDSDVDVHYNVKYNVMIISERQGNLKQSL